MPSSRRTGIMSPSRFRSHSEYSLCSAETGWTAWARRMLATPASERPKNRTFPCLTRSPTAPATSSIDTVLIEEIDVVGAEPEQGALHRLADMLRPAGCFGADLLSVLETKAKFGADYHLVAPALERPAEQLLVGEGTIALGRVEEVASQFDGAMQCSDRLSLIRRTIRLAHEHAAKTDRRYL